MQNVLTFIAKIFLFFVSSFHSLTSHLMWLIVNHKEILKQSLIIVYYLHGKERFTFVRLVTQKTEAKMQTINEDTFISLEIMTLNP